jgi:chromosome partitioning protein
MVIIAWFAGFALWYSCTMRIIAIASQKGGTGKTTTTRTLGAALAAKGRNVLLIDNDPQASLTVTCGIDAPDRNIASVYSGAAGFTDVVRMVADNLYLIPSDIALSQTEIDIVSRSYREEILTRVLQRLNAPDYVLIDCAPSLGLLTVNALRASNEILIPARPEYLGLRAMSILIKSLRKLQIDMMHDMNIIGILPTFYNSRILHHAEVIAAWRKANLPVFEMRIPQSIRASESSITGQSIIDYAPDNPVSAAYLELAEVIDG